MLSCVLLSSKEEVIAGGSEGNLSFVLAGSKKRKKGWQGIYVDSDKEQGEGGGDQGLRGGARGPLFTRQWDCNGKGGSVRRKGSPRRRRTHARLSRRTRNRIQTRGTEHATRRAQVNRRSQNPQTGQGLGKNPRSAGSITIRGPFLPNTPRQDFLLSKEEEWKKKEQRERKARG